MFCPLVLWQKFKKNIFFCGYSYFRATNGVFSVQETGHSPNKVLTMVHGFLIEMTPLYTPPKDVLGSSVHGLNYAWSCSHAVFSTRITMLFQRHQMKFILKK